MDDEMNHGDEQAKMLMLANLFRTEALIRALKKKGAIATEDMDQAMAGMAGDTNYHVALAFQLGMKPAAVQKLLALLVSSQMP